MDSGFKRQILKSGIIFSVTLVVFLSLAYWFSSDIAALTKDVDTERAANADALTSHEVLIDLRQDAAKAAQYQALFKTIIPSKDDLISMPATVGAIAAANQVQAKFAFGSDESSVVEPLSQSPGYFLFTLGAQGGFDNLIGFYKALEASGSHYAMSIDSIQLSKVGDDYDAESWGRVYFR